MYGNIQITKFTNFGIMPLKQVATEYYFYVKEKYYYSICTHNYKQKLAQKH